MTIHSSAGVLPDPRFWNGKRVLVTGHTGFKGAWLSLWLSQMGARVYGISLAPETTPNLFTLLGSDHFAESRHLDIRDYANLTSPIAQSQPDIVLHLAAQSLVRASYRQPLETFATNVLGTAHILEALRHIDCARVAVVVTTDKVYRNLEQPLAYRESDALGGHDPYSASKAGSELVVASYRDAFLAARGVAVASARAGNVIGGGDWSSDRLLPDAVRAWTAHQTLVVRQPDSIRPWQHVLEPLCGYLVLAERLWANPDLAEPYNFGPDANESASVRTVVELARNVWKDAAVSFGDTQAGPHEARLLSLDPSKARQLLGIAPRWGLQESVERTMRWHRGFAQGVSAAQLCQTDLNDYSTAAIS